MQSVEIRLESENDFIWCQDDIPNLKFKPIATGGASKNGLDPIIASDVIVGDINNYYYESKIIIIIIIINV